MGIPTKLFSIPLGKWFGKERVFSVSLPGKPGLTAKQLTDWFSYNSIEPFGEYRSELRHGQSMAFNANLNRDTKEQWEPFKAVEFMNFVEPIPEKVLTKEELEAYFDKIFSV